MQSQTVMPVREDSLINIQRVKELIGRSHAWIYREMQKEGSTFPKGIRTGGATVWSYNEIQDWIEALKADALMRYRANGVDAPTITADAEQPVPEEV